MFWCSSSHFSCRLLWILLYYSPFHLEIDYHKSFLIGFIIFLWNSVKDRNFWIGNLCRDIFHFKYICTCQCECMWWTYHHNNCDKQGSLQVDYETYHWSQLSPSSLSSFHHHSASYCSSQLPSTDSSIQHEYSWCSKVHLASIKT